MWKQMKRIPLRISSVLFKVAPPPSSRAWAGPSHQLRLQPKWMGSEWLRNTNQSSDIDRYLSGGLSRMWVSWRWSSCSSGQSPWCMSRCEPPPPPDCWTGSLWQTKCRTSNSGTGRIQADSHQLDEILYEVPVIVNTNCMNTLPVLQSRSRSELVLFGRSRC